FVGYERVRFRAACCAQRIAVFPENRVRYDTRCRAAEAVENDKGAASWVGERNRLVSRPVTRRRSAPAARYRKAGIVVPEEQEKVFTVGVGALGSAGSC